MSKKKKENSLTDEERFCLSGYAATGNADMAWRLSRSVPVTATNENAHRLALRWLRKPHVKKFVEELRLVRTKQVEATTQNRTKEQLVRELNALADSVHDPKLKADLLKQIADLERMKELRTQEEEKERRRFFVPHVSRCSNCELMKVYAQIVDEDKT